MLSSVALRAQIASIIDALSEAAVAEIAKVVEDGMVVLRLEMCQRDTEIQKLKSNIELLHGDLRSLRGGETRRPDSRARDDGQRAVGGERTSLENGPANKNHNLPDRNGPSAPELQVRVKCEPVEDGGEENRAPPAQPGGGDAASYGRDGGGQWRPAAASGRNNCGYLNLGQNSLSCLPDSSLNSGLAAPCNSSSSSNCSNSSNSSSSGGSAGFQHSIPFSRGPLGHGQYRNSYGNSYGSSYGNTYASSYGAAVRRRMAAKRFMFKKGFICSYCGKCFERGGHLERHKRIHTGEKPYCCEVCGRRFNQKCSLKEHMKIHGRCVQPSRPMEMEVGEQKPLPEVKPCTDAPRPEEGTRVEAVDVLPKNEDLLAPPVHVKREPAEENIAPPPFLAASEQTREEQGGGRDNDDDDLSQNFAAFVSDSQQWMSRLQSQSNAEIGGAEYQSMASFPGIAQLLQPAVDASCSTFSFPGKPYGELNSGAASQTPYGSSDALMLSSDAAGLHGAAPPPLLDPHRPPRGSRSFQVIKPKKCFVCSYCGKVFERVGHLERHLRIHTGEKPYGCHVCGRCFNQKSSLKGHMKTHRNGENPDALDPHHLMFTMPDSQSSKNPADPKTGLAALEEQFLGAAAAYGEAVGEQTVMVKLEPNGEDFLAPGRAASDSRLWMSVNEKSGDAEQTVCVLLQHDAKYRLGPATANAEQRGYTPPPPPPGELPFLDAKDKEGMMHNGQYSAMGEQHLAPETPANEYAAAIDDGPRAGGGFEFNMAAAAASGSHVEDGAAAAIPAAPNCFICSTCGQSFDCFGSFQRHQCANVPEPSFSCEVCGEVFTQMSVLKLHLKLHVE